MQFGTSSMCQYLEVPTSYETWMQSSLPTLPSNSHDFFCHQISILQLFSLRLPGSGQWNEGKGKVCISYNYMYIYIYMKWEIRHGRESRPNIQVLNLNKYIYIYIESLLWWNSDPYYSLMKKQSWEKPFSDGNRLSRTCSGECSAQGPSLLWSIPNQVNFRQAPCKQDYNACKTQRDRRSSMIKADLTEPHKKSTFHETSN